MPSCKFLRLQADGFHGICGHPEARQGEPCILNTEDECVLREQVITTMQISKDTLEALRAYGYPAEKAVIRLMEIAESKS
jgi:predicted metalloprotease